MVWRTVGSRTAKEHVTTDFQCASTRKIYTSLLNNHMLYLSNCFSSQVVEIHAVQLFENTMRLQKIFTGQSVKKTLLE